MARGRCFPMDRHYPVASHYSPLTGNWIDATPSTRERIASSYRRLRGSERTIRMAPDYGVEVPLWPQADETDDLVPEDLLHRLMAWQTFWESHHHFERGWDWESPGFTGGRMGRRLPPKSKLSPTTLEIQADF